MSRRKRGVAPQPPKNAWKDIRPYIADLDRLDEYLSIPSIQRILKAWNDRHLSIGEKHVLVKKLLAWEEKRPGWLKRIYE